MSNTMAFWYRNSMNLCMWYPLLSAHRTMNTHQVAQIKLRWLVHLAQVCQFRLTAAQEWIWNLPSACKISAPHRTAWQSLLSASSITEASAVLCSQSTAYVWWWWSYTKGDPWTTASQDMCMHWQQNTCNQSCLWSSRLSLHRRIFHVRTLKPPAQRLWTSVTCV